MYADARGLVVPVVTRGGQEAGPHRAVRGRHPRHRRQHPAHPGDQAVVRQGAATTPGYRSVPHHHGEAETGGYVLSGRARIYFGERFEDYLDMSEGDWVFVPPFMPHVECNLDRNKPLTWMTTRTPENIVVNLPQVDDADLRDWAGPAVTGSDASPTSRDLHRRRHAEARASAEAFDLAFTATTQPCPWPKAYGGDMVAQARGRRHALGDRRQDDALDALLLHAARRHRRRGPLRGRAAARRPRLLHPAGARLPERQAGLRLPGQLRRRRAGRQLRRPTPAGRPGPGDAAQLRDVPRRPHRRRR